MKNADKPAYSKSNSISQFEGGLTKREFFAVTILSGLSVMAIPGNHNCTDQQLNELPTKAIKLADELLTQLES